MNHLACFSFSRRHCRRHFSSSNPQALRGLDWGSSVGAPVAALMTRRKSKWWGLRSIESASNNTCDGGWSSPFWDATDGLPPPNTITRPSLGPSRMLTDFSRVELKLLCPDNPVKALPSILFEVVVSSLCVAAMLLSSHLGTTMVPQGYPTSSLLRS